MCSALVWLDSRRVPGYEQTMKNIQRHAMQLQQGKQYQDNDIFQ